MHAPTDPRSQDGKNIDFFFADVDPEDCVASSQCIESHELGDEEVYV